uniref:SMB domain-containing protein n=1 Tax=Ficedula albicollis TaxID=59894 RepID=A0A803VEI6_FICAL
MGTRCPGRTLSRSTLAAARVPRLPLPAEGTRAGGRRRRQSDTEGAVTSQGQLAAARRSPAAGTGCGDMTGDMRALLCLWLVAQVALSSRVRTRRELSPGLYQHGVYDAGGSYCQRGDVCCHGRDDGCTVPYHDTLCYCDLFCNRTVSDCCPDFWEYCLGIPAPFPKAAGEALGAGGQPWVAAGAPWGDGCGTPRSCPHCRAVPDPSELWELLQDGISEKEVWEQPVTPQPARCLGKRRLQQRGGGGGGGGATSACGQSRDVRGHARGHAGTPSQLARSRLGQADAGLGLTLPAAGGGGGGGGGQEWARAAPSSQHKALSESPRSSASSSRAQPAPLSPSRQAERI